MGLELDNTTFVQQNRMLDAALVSNPDTEKKVREIVQDELRKARNAMSQAAKSSMSSDPRAAYKAVRSSVYKKILGGNINILQPKRAGNRTPYRKPRKLDKNPHQRGGNRTPVSQRTLEMQSYYGKDRGFVLRFLNEGTPVRHTRYGNRGMITGRHWFAGKGKAEMEQAAIEIASLIDRTINEIINNG